MYPEGARELELKLENDFGPAAMHVACAYLFQQVFTYCCSLLHKARPYITVLIRTGYERREFLLNTAASHTPDRACLPFDLGEADKDA